MPNQATYTIIPHPTEGLYKEKGSKFIAYAYPIQTIDDVTRYLLQSKKRHPKARHHCFAWRLGYDKNLFRANDDGEPSGTAGKPILGQIDKNDLTNLLIIVVRYFGGTLLGASGLIRAYRNAAADAIAQASLETHPILITYKITFSYQYMSQVIGSLKKLELPLLHQQFETHGEIIFGLPILQESDLLIELKARIAKIPIEMAMEEDWPEGIQVVKTEDS